MESIIPIKGKVRHVITLDPTVWIFDDRRIDLTTYFTQEQIEIDEMEEYKKDMGKHWSREIMEGATFPPTLKTEKKYEKTKMLTGTFGILLYQFIKIAEPTDDAETIVFELANGEEYSIPLEKGDQLIFQFSDEGKPIREEGPVHLLFKDGSNQNNPIRGIQAIRID
ncbi:peptidyl-prolyl cis-trans isomerase [Sporosarcina sp. 179-K 3D1 HS]|uniref:peptidyl-prolyl cis-trans isomerase n=1 Tax=Sporosarcina sp. 179-K 3D1 HS TaxID=3232169 RepID=UPI0039A19FFF